MNDLHLLPFEQAAADLPKAEKESWRTKFDEHPMRGLLALDIRNMIKEQQRTLETVEPERLKEVQGIIRGLRQIHGLLQRTKEITK